MDPVTGDAGMCAQVEALAHEMARQVGQGLWELPAHDADLARATAARLADAVGPAPAQEALAGIERLEHLREAVAAIAIAVARTHGRLAWFLARAADALTPVLRWRALTAEDALTFGTRVPGADELTDAENAVRRLHAALAEDLDAEPAPAPAHLRSWRAGRTRAPAGAAAPGARAVVRGFRQEDNRGVASESAPSQNT
ncbi:hypothetical protein [Kitasatospora terrestris]